MSEPADKTLPEVSESFGEDEQVNVQLAKEGEENDDGEESDEYDLVDEVDSKELGEEEDDDEGDGDGNDGESQAKNRNLTAMLLADSNADEDDEDDEDEDEEDDYFEEAPETATTNGKKRARDDLAEESSEEPEGKKAKA